MTKPQPPAARVAKYRAALKAKGLEKLEIWARPEHHQQIRDYAARLREDVRR